MMKQQQSGIQYIAIIIQDYKLQCSSAAVLLQFQRQNKKRNSTICCTCIRMTIRRLHIPTKKSVDQRNQQQLYNVNLLAGYQELVLTGDSWSSKVSKYMKDHECHVKSSRLYVSKITIYAIMYNCMFHIIMHIKDCTCMNILPDKKRNIKFVILLYMYISTCMRSFKRKKIIFQIYTLRAKWHDYVQILTTVVHFIISIPTKDKSTRNSHTTVSLVESFFSR